ncbi:MAG: RNA polymerase sigma24 factor [Gemmatimonadota bacterium]
MTLPPRPADPRHLAEAFEAARPRLFGIAYRMLETRADAEDAVQEAWLRLQRAGGVDSVEGFLVTTLTRICIDELRSARVRRESYVGPWLPEPLPTGEEAAAGLDGADRAVERYEALSIALLQVLDRLDPLERAVFLLREAFSYPYEDVARIVGKRVDHCRQIAHRAAKRVRAERPRVEADAAVHERLLQTFLAAAAEGDLSALEAMLTEDVVLYSDGGGKAVAARNPVQGPWAVARFMAGIAAKGRHRATATLVRLNGLPAVVVRADGRPVVAISLDVEADRIRRVFMIRNPEKLGGV